MSRRVVIGNVPGVGFKIRAARPGYDAASAPLDGIVFDADLIPGRVIGSGTCVWTQGVRQPNPFNYGYIYKAFAHGIGRMPEQMVALAQPWQVAIDDTNFQGGGTGPSYWGAYSYNPDVQSSPLFARLGNETMTGRYCTPFEAEGNFTQGPNANPTNFQSGIKGYYASGWGYSWDATNIYIGSRQYNPLHVVWTALEV